MSAPELKSKTKAATLPNVVALLEAIETVRSRPEHLPGIAVMYGPSGFGKSVAATVAATEFDAVYVEVGESWTRRVLIESLAIELGVKLEKRLDETVKAIQFELAVSRRIVLIDEADFLIARGLIEFIRELHMKSGAPFVLIGEEGFPAKLSRIERVHNRVLVWVPAQPATIVCARKLAELHVLGITIADDLLTLLLETSKRRLRRIVVNLDRISNQARAEGITAATREWWGGRDLYTGEAPKRKVA
jgi:DNA transposition AAA+ family ATPase